MSLFENVKPEEFLLFVRNFDMNLAATGTLDMGTNIQYPRTLVRGEVLFQFDLLSDYLKNTDTLNVENIIKGLQLYPHL